MIGLKLALVALSVLGASLAARRFGHAAGGTLAGLPMIAGPIMGFVLLQAAPAQARAIALATLACLPATVAHMVCFAHASRRWRWPAAWLAANSTFMLSSAVLTRWPAPAWAVCGLALLGPIAGLAALPRVASAVPVRVPISAVELSCRVVAALAVAWAVMRGAVQLPAVLSGLLLALPITGNVLPCFTLPQHGAAAAIALIAGFVRGLFGFACFFIALYVALPRAAPGLAYAGAWLAALGAASVVTAVRRGRREQSANLPVPVDPLA